MKVLYEGYVERRRYILSALYNTLKETSFRIRSKKFVSWILISIISSLYKPSLGLAIFVILILIHVIHIVNEMFGYSTLYEKKAKSYPQGLQIKYTDQWFQSSTVFDQKWEKINWDRITLAYDNNPISNLSLYDNIKKQYHLFFLTDGNESEYADFNKMVHNKVKKVV